MSLMLQFITSYQTGTPTVMDANCSDIQNNIQYNCTAEFTVDIIPSVEIIQSVNVTVSGPYGSNSSMMEVDHEESMYMHDIKQIYTLVVTRFYKTDTNCLVKITPTVSSYGCYQL